MAIYQILIKNLDGRTLSLQIPYPAITGEYLLRQLSLKLPLPLPSLRIVSGTSEITNETLISSNGSHLYPSLCLLPRLRGGKGGFGSLLRGAASKAGQKKTSNFDACRDMNGRRLRHVNAEKRLEEWRAGEKERKLEKMAEDFLKKKAKEVKKTSDLEVEKYLQKYKEDAERCVGEVEESVRESFALYKKGKRKVLPVSGPSSSKKLKIWLGKKKAEETDSDSDSEEEKDSNSVIINEANNNSSSSSPSEEQNSRDNFNNPSFAPGSSTNGENISDTGSLETISEEETEMGPTLGVEMEGPVVKMEGANSDEETEMGPTLGVEMEGPVVVKTEGPNSDEETEMGPTLGVEMEGPVVVKMESTSSDEELEGPVIVEMEGPVIVKNESLSSGEELEGPVVKMESTNSGESEKDRVVVTNGETESQVIRVDSEVQNGDANLDEPLNLENYTAAAELEVLGMERLKSELQKNGLKCGGTLQERASRLFLLKTIPVDKLPKKLLAKK